LTGIGAHGLLDSSASGPLSCFTSLFLPAARDQTGTRELAARGGESSQGQQEERQSEPGEEKRPHASTVEQRECQQFPGIHGSTPRFQAAFRA